MKKRELGRKFRSGTFTLQVAQVYVHLDDKTDHILATSDGEPVNPYKLCENPFVHIIEYPDSILTTDLATDTDARYCPCCRGYRPHATR